MRGRDRRGPSPRACAARGRSPARRRRRTASAAQIAAAMALVAHRRVHLRVGAEPLVAVGRHQRQMMRRHLDARPVLVVGEERHLLGGRDVQHVHALACASRRGRTSRCVAISAASASRHSGCDDGSPARRRPMRSFRRASSSAWKAARRRDLRDDAVERGLVVDQQIAGRGAHEHLDAGRALEPLERGDVVDVLARAADVEGEVAEHAVARARAPCRRASRRVVVSGLVFGISNTAVTPPSTARAAAASRGPPCARGPARGNAPGCR